MFKNKSKIVFIICCTILLAAVCFSIKTYKIGNKSNSVSESVASFPKENAPSKIIKAGDIWYSFINEYGSDRYVFSIGSNPSETNAVYETSGGSIWFFEGNEKYAFWCEKDEDENHFMLYNREKNTTEEIYTIKNTEWDFQPGNVGLYKDSVFFAINRYGPLSNVNSAAIIGYDITMDELYVLFNSGYDNNNMISSFSVDENYMIISLCEADIQKIVLIDLDSPDTFFKGELSENVLYVYDAAYDSSTSEFAIYYMDVNGAEHIALPYVGGEKNIFTFNKNWYAYQDSIECFDGHIYWIGQHDISGNVAEHYRFVDYNYETDVSTEKEMTFHLSPGDEGIYLLSFDEMLYKNIELSLY